MRSPYKERRFTVGAWTSGEYSPNQVLLNKHLSSVGYLLSHRGGQILYDSFLNNLKQRAGSSADEVAKLLYDAAMVKLLLTHYSNETYMSNVGDEFDWVSRKYFNCSVSEGCGYADANLKALGLSDSLTVLYEYFMNSRFDEGAESRLAHFKTFIKAMNADDPNAAVAAVLQALEANPDFRKGIFTNRYYDHCKKAIEFFQSHADLIKPSLEALKNYHNFRRDTVPSIYVPTKSYKRMYDELDSIVDGLQPATPEKLYGLLRAKDLKAGSQNPHALFAVIHQNQSQCIKLEIAHALDQMQRPEETLAEAGLANSNTPG